MSEETAKEPREWEEPRIVAGDRVRFSDEWISCGNTQKEGECVNEGLRPDRVTVRWDGNKTASSYHRSFIELAGSPMQQIKNYGLI